MPALAGNFADAARLHGWADAQTHKRAGGQRGLASLRLRARVSPVYVSPGHRMDVETAVAVVRRLASGFREPETTRRAHALVNERRRAANARAPGPGSRGP